MPRNIDRRIEVTCPVYEEDLKDELHNYFKIQWNDNVRARILNENLDNKFRDQDPKKKKTRTQWKIYEYLKNYHTVNDLR
jgi:polyphosphate kinase